MRRQCAGKHTMANVVSGDALNRAVEDQSFIKGGSLSCAEGLKYDFRLGPRILKASFGQPIDMSILPEAEKTQIAVDPGEVLFVLTEERVELPSNMMAQLSPKRKLSHEGILVLGGLCIDPLYRGKLLVGLYNFSSTRFPLRPGKKLIAAVFYELTGDEISAFEPVETNIEDFPDELVRLIQNYRPVVLQTLQEALSETQRQLATLRTEITSGLDWQKQFQSSLDRHDGQIEKLLSALGEEKDNRKVAERDFKQELTSIQSRTWKLGAQLGAIVGGIGIVVAAFIGALVAHYLK
jgi:dUTPase